MSSFLNRLFKRSEVSSTEKKEAIFSSRYLRFRLFRNDYFDAYTELLSFEERLSSSLPISMPLIRSCTTRLTISTLQCIMHLNNLSNNRYKKLTSVFEALMESVQESLKDGIVPIEGVPVIQAKDVSNEHIGLVASSLVSLSSLHKTHPYFIQKGLFITSAAWWQYVNNQDMHDELDRIMIISQDEPGSFSAASTRIQELVKEDFPLPEHLQESISEALNAIREELNDPTKVLLLRAMAVKPDHGAIVVASLLIRTPCTDENIFSALNTSFARIYQARAILYRLKLGIRDRGMPFSWTLSVLPADHARGSAHMGFGKYADEVQLQVRRNFSDDTGYNDEEGIALSEETHAKISAACKEALTALYDEHGRLHEIFWAADSDGNVTILSAGAVQQPNKESMVNASKIADPYNNENYVHRIEGGVSCYPGVVHGVASPVRNLEDALFFPIGAILLVHKGVPNWSFLIDFAKGAVASDGTDQSLFSRTARRYGRPAILNLPEAVDAFSSDEKILVASTPENACVMGCDTNDCPTPTDVPPTIEQEGCYPTHHNIPNGLCWLSDSDIGNMAKKLAPLLLENTLPDEDTPDFSISNCKSFLDILHYTYTQTIKEMFSYSTNVKSADVPAKQLVCDVPKQFWIINLADGFKKTVKGPTVLLEDITSIPMRSFWDGFVSKPWEGPPQINARGLMSVFFEATVNPSLDPAVQSTQYVERNIFLIAKEYISIRCRFGFHFLSLDSFVGERSKERFILFKFRGGAANLARRTRRVQFVGSILEEFEFTCEISNDTLTARLEHGEMQDFLSALSIMGYLFMHTRQLDMIMGDEAALATRREAMLADLRILARGGIIPTVNEE